MQDAPRASSSSSQPVQSADAKSESSYWFALLHDWWRHILAVAGVLFLLIIVISALNGRAEGPPLPPRNPLATGHAPWFITAPGTSDTLLNLMAVVLIATILFFGVFFFWLHALPERLVHKSSKLHIDLVAVLALLSLFTHIHAFWVAALLLAFVKVPEISRTHLGRVLERMTVSLEQIADRPDSSVPRNEKQGPKPEGDAPPRIRTKGRRRSCSS